VRPKPLVPGVRVGRLAYYNNSKTLANSNVLQVRRKRACSLEGLQTCCDGWIGQVILRDHGYERVESKDDEWAIFWCAGQVSAGSPAGRSCSLGVSDRLPLALQVELADLCRLQPHQKVNKFPRASALTLKSNLWACFARMLHKYGPQHFGYMPQTFVIPAQLYVCRAGRSWPCTWRHSHGRPNTFAHNGRRHRASQVLVRGVYAVPAGRAASARAPHTHFALARREWRRLHIERRGRATCGS
jgi:hypothetical protein